MPKTRTSGIGRPKGRPNKYTSDIKEMVLGALSDVGGRQYLAERAIDQPVAFMGLIGRILPLQVTGENGAPIAVDFRWADATEPPAPQTIDAEPDTRISVMFADTVEVDGN
jgi:hypothetical protein